ncbi:MAG: tRNA 2-thiouridine(34) synthase MnmA [Buchnera aphidicola (Schlechtendalia chinensis)]
MLKFKKKVVLAMSGGVDSSVSAWILKNKNYHVEGLFMKNWEENDNNTYCSSKKDLEDAECVCDQLGIHLNKVNFSFEYWEYVFKKFLKEYKLGKTPNPDVLCNKEIKFKAFYEFAINNLGADFIATGHYVRRKDFKKLSFLLRGVDFKKDQSYFLYTINKHILKKCLFPLGKMTKDVVRKIAKRLNLVVFNKKDSTGICFINPKNFNNFLNTYIPQKKGNIITTSGKIIGLHKGLAYYTLGQRKGLGIGGMDGVKNIPWYVIEKDIICNSLIVAQGVNNHYLMSIGLIAYRLHWINKIEINDCYLCSVKVRYCQKDVECKISIYKEKMVKVLFKYPISSITPGQSVVFYLSELCLGGGIIKSRLPILTL